LPAHPCHTTVRTGHVYGGSKRFSRQRSATEGTPSEFRQAFDSAMVKAGL